MRFNFSLPDIILSTAKMAEYEERLVYESEAEKVLKDCERFLEFVKKTLP
ncbi:MAG: hypothetical protein NT166_27790 [Candidatus Aminicenantes bacterium]|nr:hypothetical protein [Candidatus Aminicenantes bacterium]